jgi:hypothetical protein
MEVSLPDDVETAPSGSQRESLATPQPPAETGVPTDEQRLTEEPHLTDEQQAALDSIRDLPVGPELRQAMARAMKAAFRREGS